MPDTKNIPKLIISRSCRFQLTSESGFIGESGLQKNPSEIPDEEIILSNFQIRKISFRNSGWGENSFEIPNRGNFLSKFQMIIFSKSNQSQKSDDLDIYLHIAPNIQDGNCFYPFSSFLPPKFSIYVCAQTCRFKDAHRIKSNFPLYFRVYKSPWPSLLPTPLSLLKQNDVRL